MTERSRAATPSPWRRPGPAVARPAAEFLPPVGAAARANTPQGAAGAFQVGPDAAAEVPPDGQPEERKRKRSRRLIRWVAIVAGVILAVLACWQDPLYAL
ncbi:hypothetical protein RB614_34875 [Phytohabitans sp. ZYX-F-186]|uniref:Uncharacterized protein n=1 Tax=Phytohabitans maris TaxID=3071409 RepID=A0ABU0ZRQ7_9ACTN|nr:hypothetical protein [Phytohabitans sp. ZYX-F-186]MDQ7909719.1 hypothetical protein [Phytohabitans sp. ZYX-F-186]